MAEKGRAPPVALFPREQRAIERWLLDPKGRGMLVVGPAGIGKSHLVGSTSAAGQAIRLECFPPVASGEIVGDLGLELLARGEERLYEAIRRGSPFALQIEIAKEALSRQSAAVWIEDANHLARGGLARFESQTRERAELFRILGNAARLGVRVIATAEDTSLLDGELNEERFQVLSLPSHLRPRDVRALWHAYGCASAEAPPDLSLPLAVRIAVRLAASGGASGGSLVELLDQVWDRLSVGARRLAAHLAYAEGPVTHGLVRFLERKAGLERGACEELTSWAILGCADGASNRVFLNPALVPLLRERVGRSDAGAAARARQILGDFWKETGRRSRRLWDLLRASQLYAEAGSAGAEHELGREVVEELLRRDYLDLGEEILSRTVKGATGRIRAVALGNLAIVRKNQGRYDEALRLYEEAWAAFEQLRDQPNVARVLHQLGNTYYLRGDLEIAGRYYEQSRGAAAECGDAAVGAAAQIQIANIQFTRGELDAAALSYVESLRTAEGMGDRRMALAVLLQLGQIHYAREAYLEAEEALAAAESLAGEIGDVMSAAKAIQLRGVVARARGDLEEAVRLLTEVERLGTLLHDPGLEGAAQYHVGSAKLEQGDLVAALKHIARAAEVFEENDRGEARAAWALIREIASRVGAALFSQLAAQAGVEWIVAAIDRAREDSGSDLGGSAGDDGIPDSAGEEG